VLIRGLIIKEVMMQILNLLYKFIKRVEGQTLTEYAILGLLILLAVIAVVTFFGQTLSALIDNFVTAAFGE
jgi:Flp pilus assembly pilin Flp